MFNAPHPLTYLDSVRAFLREDWGTQDWTTASVPDRPMAARVVAKEKLVLAGLPVAVDVFLAVDGSLRVELLAQDGDAVTPGAEVMRISGSSRKLWTKVYPSILGIKISVIIKAG